MKLLLDTHIWLWSHLEPERLAPAVAEALTDPGNEIWLSPISIWEVFKLVAKERLWLELPVQEWVQRALVNTPVRDAPLTREVALGAVGVRLAHKDPADWFLAATARAFDLALASADEYLLAGEGFQTLPNR